jgi:hypothetical protein
MDNFDLNEKHQILLLRCAEMRASNIFDKADKAEKALEAALVVISELIRRESRRGE